MCVCVCVYVCGGSTNPSEKVIMYDPLQQQQQI